MSVLSLEPLIRRIFEAWGPIAYRFRWALFIFPFILTVGLSLGFLKMNTLRVDDPSYVFTPSDARWRRELKIFSENWPLNENKFLPGKSFETKRFINVLIRARDGGSILREEVLKEIQVLNQWISNNISVSTDDGRFNLTYQDLCLSYDWVCGGNEHIDMFLQRNKDTPVYLGTVLGEVELFKENNTVKSAKVTQLFYFLKQEQSIVRRYSSDFSYAVERFFLSFYKSSIISVSFAHYQSLQDGLGENAERFAPNFFVSFTTLSIYALVCAFCLKRKPKKGIDWIRSKPWLACAGLATTLMAIVCGFGSLMMLGVSYNVINTIIPFLIIAIGIDDMFIMNACWEQSDEHQPVPVRMSETLSHAGVAVTITNITDIMSFAIGCITDLPGIQLFCLYACVSVAFCYFFQITFFCGLMAICGDLERQKRHCIFFYRTIGSISIADLSQTHKEQSAFPANLRQFQRTKRCSSRDSKSVIREQIFSTVTAFENTEYTLGREGTVFFLLEYLNYLDQLNVELEDTPKLWHHKLRSWLKYTGGASQWASDININETTKTIQSFRFSVRSELTYCLPSLAALLYEAYE
uniref:SSD domain-containing protein n=1 Tax=Angiostrongylus cantonensis TaxID=6313 RepID=A0A0K0DPR1_ANGCA